MMPRILRLDGLVNPRQREISLLISNIPPENALFFQTYARSAFVLAYAHWEGMFNECSQQFISWLQSSGCDPRFSHFPSRLLFLRPNIDRAISGSRDDPIIDLFDVAGGVAPSGPIKLDPRIVTARSNLDYDRLLTIFKVYGVWWLPLIRERVFIQHQLAGIRHQIAHGNETTARRAQLIGHLRRTRFILSEVHDYFEYLATVYYFQSRFLREYI